MKINAKLIIGGAVLGVVLCTTAASCDGTTTSSGQQTENKAARSGQADLVNNQPVPIFHKSQLRQNLIDLETALAKGVQSTSFMFPEGAASTDGKFDYPPFKVCNSIGAPISSTTELTNPQQAVDGDNGGSSYAMTSIGQMDPTGVYTGNSTGTWVMCLDASGDIRPFYWEGPVATTFGLSKWDPATKTIVDEGVPSFHFTVIH